MAWGGTGGTWFCLDGWSANELLGSLISTSYKIETTKNGEKVVMLSWENPDLYPISD